MLIILIYLFTKSAYWSYLVFQTGFLIYDKEQLFFAA
jgi:hypothetical protein